MKKRVIAICTIVAVAIIIGTWLLMRPQALGNINASFDEPTTHISNFSFVAEKGDRVKFSFRSDISAGELEIIMYSSKGNEVYVLDHAKALETFFTFDNADTYTVQAEYSDFVGNFKVSVYLANED